MLTMNYLWKMASNLLVQPATAWVNMKASVSDIAQTIHAHPTLSESILEAAEVYFNHSSHVPVKKK